MDQNKFVAGEYFGNNFTTTVQTQHIIPASNNTFNIGSNEKRFGSLFLSSNTIFMGNTSLSTVATANGSSVKLVLGFQDETGDGNTASDLVSEALVTNSQFQSFVSNTNSFITNVRQLERSALANTNARFANLTSRVVTLESGGGGGTGDVSNTAFQSFIANTNAFIKSQLANTNTRIDNVVVGTGGVSNTYLQTIVANTNARITNEGILNGIIGGSNIRLSFSSGKLMIQSIPQVDFGFITNDAGNIGDPVDERRDFGDLGGRGL